MAFIVILFCLAVQWFLKFSSANYQLSWADYYSHWMQKRIIAITTGHGLVGVLLLALPIIIIASIIFTMVYHGLGHFGYFIVSLILLWYCLDALSWRQSINVPQLFLKSYQHIFAILFWYFVFGPVGLVIYVVIDHLRAHFETRSADEPIRKTVLPALIQVQGVLDWVPVRLLGLTFALAGHFSPVFNRWMTDLLQSISNDQHLVTAWGEVAIQPEVTSTAEAVGLVDRSLIIWLVVMALISLGFWMG